MKISQLRKPAMGFLSTLLIYTSAWSEPVILSDPFNFRNQFNDNYLFGRLDLITVGVNSVEPVAGTSLTASQGSVTQPIPTNSTFFDTSFPYDSSLTGAWTITAVNGNDTRSVQTNDIIGVEPLPFVENLTVSRALLTPTVTWSLPDTAVPHNRVRVRVYAGNNLLYTSPSLGLANSFDIPEGLLAQGQWYALRVMLEDTTRGFFVNRSSSYIGYNPSTTPQANLESPQQGSFESGIGLIRGYVCQAGTVEIRIDNLAPLKVAYGSSRPDTVPTCGDDNNGFGFTVNWNSLGNGNHTLRAFADGAQFASASFNVTTLGEEYLRGVSGEYTLPDFPQAGRNVTVRWAESHQNFVIVGASPNAAAVQAATTVLPQAAELPANLESPQQGSFESGIGLIRGWICQANTVEIQIDGGARLQAPYGSIRPDTAEACGDTDNGFGFTTNWSSLGDGTHTLQAFADGVEFANVTFTVTTLGVVYLPGASGEYMVPDFPQAGRNVTLRWAEPHQNFVIVNAR